MNEQKKIKRFDPLTLTILSVAKHLFSPGGADIF